LDQGPARTQKNGVYLTMSNPQQPIVALVGRPNVGKSTLFNRIVRRRVSIVHDQPGVTRDRHYAEADWAGWGFLLVDTGGFDPTDKQGVMAAVRGQCLAAIEEADVILFVADARQGLTPDDEQIADMLRRSDKPVVWAANKADSPMIEANVAEMYQLGVPEIHPIAASGGRGIGDLLDAVVDAVSKIPGATRLDTEATDALAEQGPDVISDQDEDEAKPTEQTPIRLALVGRPNAGKSSILNRLTGEDRSVVHNEPGTTRDPVDVQLVHEGRPIVIVDTAGIRRRKYVKEALEHIGALQAIRAMQRAQVACLVCDATVGVTDQEARLASAIWDAGRALVIVINKWDLVLSNEQRAAIKEQLETKLRFASHCPIVRTSAKTGRGMKKILPAAIEVFGEAGRRIKTSELNQWLAATITKRPPAAFRGKHVKFYYITQPQTHPPTFILFSNYPQAVTAPYRRFLTNQLRDAFGFDGTAIRIFLKARSDDSNTA